MAKPAKKKMEVAPTARGHGKQPSRAKHHGRTFCAYCTRKIAFGNAFCNSKCRAAYKG